MVLTPLYLMELTLIHYNVVHYYCFLPVPEGSRLKKNGTSSSSFTLDTQRIGSHTTYGQNVTETNESLTTFVTMKTKYAESESMEMPLVANEMSHEMPGHCLLFLSPFSGRRSGFLFIFSFLGGLIPVCNFEL